MLGEPKLKITTGILAVLLIAGCGSVEQPPLSTTIPTPRPAPTATIDAVLPAVLKEQGFEAFYQNLPEGNGIYILPEVAGVIDPEDGQAKYERNGQEIETGLEGYVASDFLQQESPITTERTNITLKSHDGVQGPNVSLIVNAGNNSNEYQDQSLEHTYPTTTQIISELVSESERYGLTGLGQLFRNSLQESSRLNIAWSIYHQIPQYGALMIPSDVSQNLTPDVLREVFKYGPNDGATVAQVFMQVSPLLTSVNYSEPAPMSSGAKTLMVYERVGDKWVLNSTVACMMNIPRSLNIEIEAYRDGPRLNKFMPRIESSFVNEYANILAGIMYGRDPELFIQWVRTQVKINTGVDLPPPVNPHDPLEALKYQDALSTLAMFKYQQTVGFER